jgi:putative phosphoesterase
MRIAVISDIHANLFALEAVLAHAQNLGIKNFWCLGDYVHFNAFSQEVVKNIRKLDAECIYGNIDVSVMESRKYLYKKKKQEIPEENKPFIASYEQLSDKSREFLRDLPMKKRIKIRGNRFLLVHGSPAAYDDPIRVDTPDERLRELIKLTNAEFILCGHTHVPFVREVDGITFINPGSVGKPIDGDPRACYAVLKVKKDEVSVEPYRVDYNIDEALSSMREAELPELYIRSLQLSLGHDKVLAIMQAEQEKK